MNGKDTVTIRDIAEESGVSIATVSRVLNGNVAVSAEKKERVEKVIRKYQFTPNALARGLIRRETKTLGVVLPDIGNPYFSTMFLEVERVALEMGYSILLCNTLFGGSSHGIGHTIAEEVYFQMLIDKQVDGVLIIGGQVDLETISDSYMESLKQLSNTLPVVVIGRHIDDMDCLFVEQESGSGIIIAVNYLYMLGHRRIAFVGGQPHVTITEIRINAYKYALSALKLPAGEELIALSNYYAEDGYTAIQTLLDRHAQFTAFVAVNDAVAQGAIRSLADHGYRTPEDIAVISCDQFLSGEYHVPRLSSVNQRHEILARTVINALIQFIRGAKDPVRFTFAPELIIRESCGTTLGIRNFSEKTRKEEPL